MKEKTISDEEIIKEFNKTGELHFTPICRNCSHDVIDLAMQNSDSILAYISCLSKEDQMYKVDIYNEDVIFEEETIKLEK